MRGGNFRHFFRSGFPGTKKKVAGKRIYRKKVAGVFLPSAIWSNRKVFFGARCEIKISKKRLPSRGVLGIPAASLGPKGFSTIETVEVVA